MSEYCEHGNLIGTPLGPDFICGPCEDGIPAHRQVTVHSVQNRMGDRLALCVGNDDETGDHVTFRLDTRQAWDLSQNLREGHDVSVAVPDWAIVRTYSEVEA